MKIEESTPQHDRVCCSLGPFGAQWGFRSCVCVCVCVGEVGFRV